MTQDSASAADGGDVDPQNARTLGDRLRQLLLAAALLGAVVLLGAGVTAGSAGADEPAAAQPSNGLTTTGPVPPATVKAPSRSSSDAAGVTGQVLLGDVPAYQWRDGCAPTSLGMVIGYYDAHGFSGLIPGDASTQTESVSQSIASRGSAVTPRHYEDYVLPMEDGDTILADRSEAPAGDEHASDCIADFMHTSWSVDGLAYGWSWVSMTGPAFVDYVALRDPSAVAGYRDLRVSATGTRELSFAVLQAEIDAGRPMVLYVDSDGDGSSDHAVAGIGYRETAGYPEYACRDTWFSTVRWSRFREVSPAYDWGVYGGTAFTLTPSGQPLDSSPPVTTVAGSDDGWSPTPVTLTFTATDEGSGVDHVEAGVDGAFLAPLAGLPAALEVSGQGEHTVSYRARDRQGNVESTRTCTVRIDARGPVTSARAARVRRGARVILRYAAADLTPKANVRLVVRTLSGARRATLRRGWRRTGTLLRVSWRCTLRRGTYRVWVYATDQAGNRQVKAGRARLTVR
jgi:hypothetical protein